MTAQMIAAMPRASAVVDEPAHLTAGYLALAQGDLSVNREHPPLVKTLAALPLLAIGPALPPETPGGPPRWSEDFEFAYSREFLYKANDADRLLSLARLPVVLLTLLAGGILFAWGRALLGPTGGLAALALFAFEPNLLAHGRLVTTDMGASCFTLATLACLERSRTPRAPRDGSPWRWELLGGLCLGLALLSRFSSILLIPILALVAFLDRGRAPRRGWLGPLRILVVALGIVNAGYGLPPRGLLFPLAADPVTEPFRTGPLAAMEAGAITRWLPVPLPRLYLEGLDLARFKNREVEGPGYLNGAISRDGWWSYFLQALAMKTTLPFLLLAVSGTALLAAGARRPDSRAAPAIFVLVPAAAILLLTTLLTRAQIGLRYVLPVLPLLCLAGGAAAARLAALRRPALGAVLAAALLWHAGSTLAIHPYHLAYFNELAGGPSRGWRHLVDSNLDWGQDLVGLRSFMKERDVSRINLYYFGTADPEYYGIHRAVPPEPGWFAVSATHLMGVYLPDRDYLAPLRSMRPEAVIGHSILVYRFDPVPAFLQVPIRRR